MIEDEEEHFLDDRVDGEETEGDNEGVVAPTDDPRDEADR